MTKPDRPAVEESFPPKALLAVAGPIVRAVLGSRLHALLDRDMVVLHLIGRRTGRSYDVPVSRHDYDGRIAVHLGGRWRVNMRDGTDIEMTVGGERHRAAVSVVTDPQRVAEVFTHILRTRGLRRAARVALRINVGRQPTVEEVRRATSHRWIGLFTLVGARDDAAMHADRQSIAFRSNTDHVADDELVEHAQQVHPALPVGADPARYLKLRKEYEAQRWDRGRIGPKGADEARQAPVSCAGDPWHESADPGGSSHGGWKADGGGGAGEEGAARSSYRVSSQGRQRREGPPGPSNHAVDFRRGTPRRRIADPSAPDGPEADGAYDRTDGRA